MYEYIVSKLFHKKIYYSALHSQCAILQFPLNDGHLNCGNTKTVFSMKFRVEWNYPGKTMVSGLWEKLSTLSYIQQSHVIVCASIFRYCGRAWKCVRTYTGITIWKLGTLYWRKCKWMSSFMTLTWQYITPYNLKDKKHSTQFDKFYNHTIFTET